MTRQVKKSFVVRNFKDPFEGLKSTSKGGSKVKFLNGSDFTWTLLPFQKLNREGINEHCSFLPASEKQTYSSSFVRLQYSCLHCVELQLFSEAAVS